MSEADEIQQQQRRAVFHGGVNILLGCLAGLPYTLVVLRDHHPQWSVEEQTELKQKTTALYELAMKFTGTERAWKMAHLEGILNGAIALILASVFPTLKLTAGEFKSLATAVAVCAYGNSIGSGIAAAFNVRGFVFAGSLPNRAAGLCYFTAVLVVFCSLQLVLKGSMS